MLNISTHSLDLLLAQADRALAAGSFLQAIPPLQQFLARNPRHAPALCRLGIALAQSGRTADALIPLSQAVSLDPAHADAWLRLGTLLRLTGNLADSASALGKATALLPQNADAFHELGITLQFAHRFPEAIAAFQQCLALYPTHVGALNNLGNIHKTLGRFGDALAAYAHARQINPQSLPTLSNLGALQLLMGHPAAAADTFRHALTLDPASPYLRSNHLYALQFLPDQDPRTVFQAHHDWQNFAASNVHPPVRFPNTPDPHRRLRVGYISADFRAHSISHFIENILLHHDRPNVEVFCYAEPLSTDQTTERLRAHADHWRIIKGSPDDHVFHLIQQDQIDILVDLHGHTAGNRLALFARKPAPIQISYLGYPNTTGLSAIDYRLTDAHADPLSASPNDPPDCYHTEKLLRLPHSFLCYRPPDDAPRPALSPHPDNPGRITFCSFNSLPKLSAPTLALWSKLLHRLPQAHLLLKSAGLHDPATRAHLLAQFQTHNIPDSRLTLLPATPDLPSHLATYHHADIALDPFPYHGTTTTLEALHMGLPVITLAGFAHANRVGVSILTNMNLPDLIAQSEDHYLEIAASLATDPTRLDHFHKTLRPTLLSSPLTNAPQFIQNLESTYRTLWQTYCASRSSR